MLVDVIGGGADVVVGMVEGVKGRGVDKDRTLKNHDIRVKRERLQIS